MPVIHQLPAQSARVTRARFPGKDPPPDRDHLAPDRLWRHGDRVQLATFLQEAAPYTCGWSVFDKSLVTKMLQEHNLPDQLARFMPEDRISSVQDVIEQLLGLHPPSETLIRQISETVLHLADLGHVILVGRAANVITRNRKNVFHVRLVAPLEKRVAQVMARSKLSQEAAEHFIREEDSARNRYLKQYFKHDPDEVLTYDLVLNTARFTPPQAAKILGQAVLEWMGPG